MILLKHISIMIKKNYLIIFCIFSFFLSRCFALQIDALTTTNGIKIWLNQDNTLPIVDIIINFKNCGYIYDDRNASNIGQFLQEAINQGLFVTHQQQYLEELYEKNIAIKATIHEEFFSIKIRSLKQDIQRSLELFQMATTFQNIEHQNIENIKHKIEENDRKNQYDTANYLTQSYKNILFPNHPYANKNIKKNPLNNEKLLHKYESVFTRDNLIVSIAGNIGENITQQIDRNLSHLLFRKNNKKIAHYSKTKPQKATLYNQHLNEISSLGFVLPTPNENNYFQQLIIQNIFNLNFNNEDYGGINTITKNLDQSSIYILFAEKYSIQELISKINELINEENIEISCQNLAKKIQYMDKLPLSEKAQLIDFIQKFKFDKDYFQKLATNKCNKYEIKTYIQNKIRNSSHITVKENH